MNMRKQFVTTVQSLMSEDERLILLLGDIGVFGFRRAFELYPKRVYNIGILEQSTIGLASGLSIQEFIPVVHTIAPFLVERSLEQLKLDFCYQKLGGNFISVGASYDYSALGSTHHCPADVGILKQLPGMEIILPGTSDEFDALFRQTYCNGKPTYFRLSERENTHGYDVHVGRAEVIKKGNLATIVAVGTALKSVLEASEGLDVTILYYTSIVPFDSDTLIKNCCNSKVILCEPYYSGALTFEIINALKPRPVSIEFIGIPCDFLNNYGTPEEQDKILGLTSDEIRHKMEGFINE